MTSERRTTTRLRTIKGAAIRFGSTSIECTIRNLSERGAALEVGSPVGIPDEFTLWFKQNGLKRNCRVAWRSADRIGVQFLSAVSA